MNICISIGHGKSAKGGYDSGALGGNYQEFKIAREIGKYIGEVFKGYDCTADVINYDATLYLTDRIAHVNKHGYDLAMEIHLNASGGTGSEVYYKHKSATGKKLAGAISKSIANTFGIRDRGAKVKINPSNGTDYFGFVRSCKCESLLIETVFIDTASDRKHVETAAGQRQCAEAIVSAIANFYGIKKKSAPAVKPSEDKPTAATVRAGDIVKIKGSRYATGQKIPMWVKLKKHTVEGNSDGNYTVTSCDATVEQIDAAFNADKNIVLTVAQNDRTNKYVLSLTYAMPEFGYLFESFYDTAFLIASIDKTNGATFARTQTPANAIDYSNAALPSISTVGGALDALVPKSHTHANKDTLDKLSVSNGKLQYNGSDVGLKGDKGADGKDGANGITPTIGTNGNWYLGTTDTGKPSRGEKGDTGAAGANGHTPVKGTDYWTAADKAEIVAYTLAALPTWTGGSY